MNTPETSTAVPEPLPGGGAEQRTFFTIGGLRSMITQSVYRGVLRVKHTNLDLPPGASATVQYDEFRGRHTPLVSDEVWFKANRMLKPVDKEHANTRRPRAGCSIGLLQGLLFCDCCDAAMSPGLSTKVQKSGKRHTYYRCLRLMKGGRQSNCTTKQISGSAIEGVVMAVIQQVAANPSNFVRFGQETDDSRRGQTVARLNADILGIERQVEEHNSGIEKLMKFVRQGDAAALTPDAIAAASKLKVELADLEFQRIQLEYQRNKAAQKVPPLTDLANAFGRIVRALQLSGHKNRYDIFQAIIRSVGLRRVVVGGPQPVRCRRTFRATIEFRTDEIIHFGEEGVSSLTMSSGYANAILRVTFDVESNNTRQRITLLELGYRFIAASFDPPAGLQAAHLEANGNGPPLPPEAENPIQRAIRWKTLLDSDPKRTMTSLAATEKVSTALVSQHVSLLKLPPLIVDFMQEGRDSDPAATKKISFRELLSLLTLPASDAIARFHERVAGIPLQEWLPLDPSRKTSRRHRPSAPTVPKGNCET